jgi:hypothetical protein
MSQPLRSATEPAAAGTTVNAGERFARALASKDRATLHALLADPVDFQALTPRRHWQADTAGAVVDDVILGTWFDAGDDIEAVLALSNSDLPGRQRVSYQLRVRNADGVHVVEQQAYYNTEGGRISWLRILCSGYLPLLG